jgi:hypothetical protein
MNYLATNTLNETVKLIPDEYMLQRYSKSGNYDDVEVLESTERIKVACTKVYKNNRYRIVPLADGDHSINIAKAA